MNKKPITPVVLYTLGCAVRYVWRRSVGLLAQVGFSAAYLRHWRAQKADSRRRSCRKNPTCAKTLLTCARS